jgi:hypothetical protein
MNIGRRSFHGLKNSRKVGLHAIKETITTTSKINKWVTICMESTAKTTTHPRRMILSKGAILWKMDVLPFKYTRPKGSSGN